MEPASEERPRRGRPRSLTLDQIVEAALALVADRRFEDMSMRDLANEAGVPVMTLYNYVSSKEELSSLIVDHILGPVPIPGADEGTWDERIRILQREARRAMAGSRGVSFRNGVRSKESQRLGEGVISILIDGGFEPVEAARAFSTLYTFMIGQIEVDAFAHTVAGGEPTFAEFTASTGLSGDELFEFGFDVVLEGLQARLDLPSG